MAKNSSRGHAGLGKGQRERMMFLGIAIQQRDMQAVEDRGGQREQIADVQPGGAGVCQQIQPGQS